jgi:hypothetical protein
MSADGAVNGRHIPSPPIYGNETWGKSYLPIYCGYKVAMSPTSHANGSAILPDKTGATAHRDLAASGQGIYITLRLGHQAAVTCLGNGHPVVQEALKNRLTSLFVSNSPNRFIGEADGGLRCVHRGVFERARCRGLENPHRFGKRSV